VCWASNFSKLYRAEICVPYQRAWPPRSDRPRQSGTAQRVSIAVVRHAGKAAVGYGELAGESHHQVNGEHSGDAATHRCTTASLEITTKRKIHFYEYRLYVRVNFGWVNPSALRGIIGNLGQATRGKQQRGFAFRHTRSPFYGGGLPTRPTPLTSVPRESICSQDPQIAKPILDNENRSGLICR